MPDIPVLHKMSSVLLLQYKDECEIHATVFVSPAKHSGTLGSLCPASVR